MRTSGYSPVCTRPRTLARCPRRCWTPAPLWRVDPGRRGATLGDLLAGEQDRVAGQVGVVTGRAVDAECVAQLGLSPCGGIGAQVEHPQPQPRQGVIWLSLSGRDQLRPRVGGVVSALV